MSFQVPPALLDGVVARFDPVAVYLFGSHARGEAGEDSDIDLYVVIDDAETSKFKGQQIGQARAAFAGAVDIVLASASQHEDRKDVLGTLAEIVQSEGVKVYARHV